MKISNWKRKLVSALVAGGLMSPGALHAADLNTNLVINGDFENIDFGTTGGYGGPLILDWADGTNTTPFSYSHDGFGGVPDYANGGPLAGGGSFYFTSNSGTDVTGAGQATQLIDVSTGASGALIATGNAAFNLSAFFSSFAGDGDFGNAQVDFLDGGSNNIGSGVVADGDTSTWTQNSTGGLIPIGTATVQLSVFGTALAGGPDGYIDNVDFQITEQVILPSLDIAIDRSTGNVVLSNQTDAPVHISGYSITSGFGALSPGDWTSIAENYDAGSPGPNQVDANNNWSELTQPDDHGDLSEADFDSATGTTLAVGASIDLGNAWIQNVNEDDIVFQFISNGQAESGVVGFAGAGGPLSLGDLDFDGDLDADDWGIFRAGQQADMTGLSGAEAYQMGDLTGDMANNHPDFVVFKTAFDGANGAGAFDGMLAGVPEPSGLVLLVGAGLALFGTAVRRRGS